MYLVKRKKTDTVNSTAWDSIYMTFWTPKNYRDRNRSVMARGWGAGYELTTKGPGGVLGVMQLSLLYLDFSGGYRCYIC